MRLRDLLLLLGLLLLPAPAVKAAVGGIVSGGGAGGSAYEAEASTFFTSAGVTNRIGQYRLDGFVKASKALGLWSTYEDVVPLSSIMQRTNGNNLASMKGKFSALFVTNGPLWGLRGLSFDGVNDHLLGFLRTPLTTFSISCAVQGSTNYTSGQIPGWFGMLNSAYNQYHIFGALSGAYDQSWMLTQGDGGANTGHFLIVYDVGGPFRGYSHMGTSRKYVTWAHDNSGSGNSCAWVNGARTLLAGTVTSRTFTSGASVMCAGARIDTGTPNEFAKCNMAAIVISNVKYTDTQASNLVQCMRWLDPARENLVVAGDSMSREPDPSGSYAIWQGWPSILELHKNMSNRFAIFNSAYNGVAAANYSYDVNIAPFAPGKGGVDDATLIIWLGYNDVFGGALGATLYTTLDNLAQRARNDGYKVGIVLHPIGARLMGAFSVTESVTNLLAAHSLILTNRENFDFIIRADNVFGSTNGNANLDDGWFPDGLHPNATGEVAVAQTISQALSGVRDSAQQWTWNQGVTNSGAGATTLLFNWMPGNELRTKGDVVRFELVGGFTNEVTKAKLLTFNYGSQEVLNIASRVAHQGPWRATVSIRQIHNNSQFVECEFTGTATNFSHFLFTSQTSSIPTLCRVIGTGADSGVLTNQTLTKIWEPLR